MEIDKAIKNLETLGIITIENIIPDSTLSQLNKIFTSAFSTILDNYNSIIWYRREYKANARKYDNFIGTDLYNNKKIGYVPNCQIKELCKENITEPLKIINIKLINGNYGIRVIPKCFYIYDKILESKVFFSDD